MQIQRKVRAESLRKGERTYSDKWVVVTYEPRKRKKDGVWIWWTKARSKPRTRAELRERFEDTLLSAPVFRRPLDVAELACLRGELSSDEERARITALIVTRRLRPLA